MPSARKAKRIHLRYLDYRLILYALALSVIGVLVVRSATVNEASTGVLSTMQKQILAVVIGLIAMVVLLFIDYHTLIRLAPLLYLISAALLIYVKFINPAGIANADRWMRIPGFGTVQPSEFSKVAVAVTGTFLIMRAGKRLNNVLFILFYLLVGGATVALIYIEPDLSTSLIILFGMAALLFVAGISWKWVFGVLAVFGALFGLVAYWIYEPEQKTLNWFVEQEIVKEYQVNRVNSFFFPEEYPDLVHQQLYSVMAIGGGQLTGKGLNTSTYESVKNGNFLSEEQTDMIFAVVGEELGFIGSAFIILLYLLLFIEGLRIAGRSPDREGRILAGGLVAMMAFQCFINMGVSMLLLPNTGTPLPFISAGMSSLISCYLSIGILLNIGMQRKMKII